MIPSVSIRSHTLPEATLATALGTELLHPLVMKKGYSPLRKLNKVGAIKSCYLYIMLKSDVATLAVQAMSWFILPYSVLHTPQLA